VHAIDPQLAIGAVLALVLAVATVLYDCHVAVQDRLKRVPLMIFKVPAALALSLACGLTAAFAFAFTDGKGTTLVDSVLGLQQPNALLRGAIVRPDRTGADPQQNLQFQGGRDWWRADL
jgi:hypothetical protein